MFPHHEGSIAKVKAHFEADPSVLALLLTGSIAHGFESPESDVDVAIVISDEQLASLVENSKRYTYKNHELCTYPKGYVDGKFVSVEFMRRVAQDGSEPARFAFEGARVLFSRIEGLEELLKEVVKYPVAGKRKRMVSFRAEVEAWNWYCSEARKRDNPYLLSLSAAKLALFGTRLILAHNEVLYPFHKWMLKVLEGVTEKPEGMVQCVEELCRNPTEENVRAFYEMVTGFREWEEGPNGWGTEFMKDVELAWMNGSASVDDL